MESLRVFARKQNLLLDCSVSFNTWKFADDNL